MLSGAEPSNKAALSAGLALHARFALTADADPIAGYPQRDSPPGVCAGSGDRLQERSACSA